MERCSDCKCDLSSLKNDIVNGYGQTKEGVKVCYQCCAERDKEKMVSTGRIVLYCDGKTAQNWPGSLKFNLSSDKFSTSKRKRYSFFFFCEKKAKGGFWYGMSEGKGYPCVFKKLKYAGG